MISWLLITLAQIAGQAPSTPELDYLVGEFRADVELYDAAGNVSRNAKSEIQAHRIFDGNALEQTGALLDLGAEARSFYFVDEVTKVVRWAALSSNLELNVFSGALENGELTLTADGRGRDARPLQFKRVDRKISNDGYEMSMYVSDAGAGEWRLINRQFNRRLERGEAAVEALRSYAGVWLGEEHRRTQAGDGFRFRYALEPMDASETIYEMTITQEMDDGAAQLLFKGFKNYDAHEDVVRYHGFSPSGRVARGRVLLVGETLETIYEGASPNGPPAEIKDVFTHLGDDRFHSITYMRRDGTWTQINEDHWKRATR